jgi:hypothetical protein
MPEVVGEGLEELADRMAQLSERQAANARILLEEIQRRRSEARGQGRNFSAPTGAQVLDQLEGRALTQHSRGPNHGRIHRRGA